MSERARHFPERGAVKPHPTRCAAAAVCARDKDEHCPSPALPGREWCWTHQLVLNEGRKVERYNGSAQ